MGHVGKSSITISLALVILAGALGNPCFVNAASPLPGNESFRVAAFPIYSQEGSTITIVLSVGNAAPSTTYEFDFLVRDPSTSIWTSSHKQYATLPGEWEFSIITAFPGADFLGGASTSLAGTYVVSVNERLPMARFNVAATVFWVGLTNKTLYERTETVSIIATGYSAGESVSVFIRTSITATLVYSNTAVASNVGQVNDSWKVPKNATTSEDYILTLSGTITSKTPADAQGFNVQVALMTIPSLSSSQSSYQRTGTLSFSFRAVYPTGENATTGIGLVTLTRPDRANITLTANYNVTTLTFVAKYKTSTTNQTGTWTASLSPYSYDDGFGNQGPNGPLASAPVLQTATLAISLQMKTSFAASELIRFNATITYPDGAFLPSSSTVTSTISYSGGGYSSQVPVVYDSALTLWVGTYSPQGNEPSGLWSLLVSAVDSAQPNNSGSLTRAITVQNRPPYATFSGSTNNAQTGVSISFDASSSSDPDGTIVNYLWDFGDGSSGSGVITSHTYATAGSYTVRLTVADNIGGTATTNSALTITAAPTPPSSTGGNVTFPLYWFAILAALIAAGLAGAFLAFRRHKVTHARLKIDLEAVRTEAGRIENNEFFQSVKDQLKKDKND